MVDKPGPPEEVAEGLLASYPNLRGLGQLDSPEADWGCTKLPSLPPEAKTGVLANGLTWIVHENREPKARAEFYLVVGFGSLVEEEEERGIAHIIEHLGFSATKAYENHAIVKYLESIGAPFGACQNAYTSFDRTVYTLHVPTDKEGIVAETLTVLREFAYFTRISEEDLDKERKVVLEEWRESKNAQGRLFEQYIQALCKGCKWCERLPIGKEDVIRGVSAETLRKFYARFYHPAQMAVLAVGDFDGSMVLDKIKELFEISPGEISPLPRAPQAPDRPRIAVPDTVGVAVASSTDAELSFAQGMLDCKRPKQGLASVGSFRRRLSEDIFHKALGSRLLKLTMEPKGPRNFFMVSTETGEPIPPLNPMSIMLAPLPGRMRPALRSVVQEIVRVKRLGFHEAEVLRAKRCVLAEFEQEYIEREQRPSDAYADEYVGYILDEQPAPGIEHRARAAATVLPTISSDEVARIAQGFDFSRNVVIKLSTPPLSIWNPLYTLWSLAQAVWHLQCPRPRMDLPDSLEVSELLKAVEREVLEHWPEDEDDVDSRLRRRFEACASRRMSLTGLQSSIRAVDAPGVSRPVRGASLVMLPRAEPSQVGEEIILQNGMRIFLKATDMFDDEIVMRARRWGGLSEYQGNGFFGRGMITCEAQTCSMVAMMLGICGLTMESLQECLDGRRVEPNPPDLDAYSTVMDGQSSPIDVEALLMLLNLLFLSPVAPGEKSRGRLSLVKFGLLAWRLAENRDPQALFRRRLLKCINEDHPYTRMPSLWSILFLNFKRASAIFNERCSMPREWTFAFVGRLPAKDLFVPLLEKYLGSIPNADGEGVIDTGSSIQREMAAREAVTPLDIKFPSKSVREDVKINMVEPKGSTVLCFPILLTAVTVAGSIDSAEAELRELSCLRLMVRLLETRLVEVLRFKRGQVYSVSVVDDLKLSPPQLGIPRSGTLSISFECDPAESDELVAATQAELQLLRDGLAAFTEENVKSALEQDRRQFEELFQKNDWWANTVLDLYFSRCHAVTGEIGASVSLWWRVRTEVTQSFNAAMAAEVLRAALPADAVSAVIAMRPKGSIPKKDSGGGAQSSSEGTGGDAAGSQG